MAQDPRTHTEEIGRHPAPGHDGAGAQGGAHSTAYRSWEELAIAQDEDAWRARSRVFLTPIAAPSIMGLFGFMIATLMVGAWQAGWYGNADTPLTIWPFALVAGGILQSIAAVASFRARDGVAVAVHTAWGSFWIGWGIMQLLVATGVMLPIALGTVSASFGIWFVALTLVTTMGMLGSLAQSVGLFAVLGSLSAGSALTAAGFFAGSLGTLRAGGWLFVIAAAAAWLVAGAMTLEHAFGRTIIPLGKWSMAANIPGRSPTVPIAYPSGMPGVRVGQ
ncbi:MAG TPA: GPR1/FUN34/YaaH family transporter [Jatrophihabitantaceae bacterium]|nr:GPR1/FUN34/YaaH family transporter [Jatrophihabitantaceae bacterium]